MVQFHDGSGMSGNCFIPVHEASALDSKKTLKEKFDLPFKEGAISHVSKTHGTQSQRLPRPSSTWASPLRGSRGSLLPLAGFGAEPQLKKNRLKPNNTLRKACRLLLKEPPARPTQDRSGFLYLTECRVRPRAGAVIPAWVRSPLSRACAIQFSSSCPRPICASVPAMLRAIL